MAKIVVITSGKGGVGKTTTSASFAAGLALRGYKTVVIDFDVGLRNLDLIMGCENRIVYDFVDVINGNARLSQALVKDKQLENKDSQISQMQNLLDQQQRLALQDKKLLEEYKSENDRLKVLKMPSQETEFKHLDNQYKDEVNALKEKLENLQEQIKVKKRIEEQEKQRKWWGLWRK